MNPPNTETEWARLPKEGQTLCGCTRNVINKLILPKFYPKGEKPPVKSVSVRRPGYSKGIRLVSVPSLKAHLTRLCEEQLAAIEGGAE